METNTYTKRVHSSNSRSGKKGTECQDYLCKRGHETVKIRLPTLGNSLSNYELKLMKDSGYVGSLPREYFSILYILLGVEGNTTLLQKKLGKGIGYVDTHGKRYGLTRVMAEYLGEWWQSWSYDYSRGARAFKAVKLDGGKLITTTDYH